MRQNRKGGYQCQDQRPLSIPESFRTCVVRRISAWRRINNTYDYCFGPYSACSVYLEIARGTARPPGFEGFGAASAGGSARRAARAQSVQNHPCRPSNRGGVGFVQCLPDAPPAHVPRDLHHRDPQPVAAGGVRFSFIWHRSAGWRTILCTPTVATWKTWRTTLPKKGKGDSHCRRRRLPHLSPGPNPQGPEHANCRPQARRHPGFSPFPPDHRPRHHRHPCATGTPQARTIMLPKILSPKLRVLQLISLAPESQVISVFPRCGDSRTALRQRAARDGIVRAIGSGS